MQQLRGSAVVLLHSVLHAVRVDWQCSGARAFDRPREADSLSKGEMQRRYNF